MLTAILAFLAASSVASLVVATTILWSLPRPRHGKFSRSYPRDLAEARAQAQVTTLGTGS